MAQNNAPQEAPLTATDLAALLAQQNANFQQQMLDMIRELKKPTEIEAKKIADEERRIKERAAQSVEMAKREAAARAETRSRCGHARGLPGGGVFHLWRSPMYSDGNIRPLCLECQTELPPVKGIEQWKETGVELQRYKGLTMHTLVEWHKKSYPDCKSCDFCKPQLAVSA